MRCAALEVGGCESQRRRRGSSPSRRSQSLLRCSGDEFTWVGVQAEMALASFMTRVGCGVGCVLGLATILVWFGLWCLWCFTVDSGDSFASSQSPSLRFSKAARVVPALVSVVTEFLLCPVTFPVSVKGHLIHQCKADVAQNLPTYNKTLTALSLAVCEILSIFMHTTAIAARWFKNSARPYAH
ncbi:hypothetical protein F2Q69_00017425 [Brassica cretica]|uniref:Uncharacterized protein n=1 Tax=Brassica cretica TaxID=69181 RepID=A0A8S9R5E4_BRACR|nr:hypothetical protein F2Q69_00017425 [Brassica cretica]